jgi:predicted O-methyltransferase YrrM
MVLGVRESNAVGYNKDLSPEARRKVLAELAKVFSKHWKPGYGSITAAEALFIRNLIDTYRPSKVLEIGMASGLSCGLIASFLDEFGGTQVVTIDHDNTFFGDTTKPNGFLIEEIYAGKLISVQKLPFHTALDLDRLSTNFDLVFIDANHQHPWPTLDTLMVYPWLGANNIIIHHDYNLYAKQVKPIGIGPKYLYDQFPDHLKFRSPEDDGNIFALSLQMDANDLEKIAIASLMLPWTLHTPLAREGPNGLADRIMTLLAKNYSSNLVDAFQAALAKFEPSDE